MSSDDVHGNQAIQRVLLTGATGFVGRYVVRELITRGYHPVCLLRSPGRMSGVVPEIRESQVTTIHGTITDAGALRDAARQSEAAIHLVGIIHERRWTGQTFDRVHRLGTMAVVDALEPAGVRRYVHMSALGVRPDAVSNYHKSKFAAEQYVRDSGLDWTILQPSLIHGPDGEFMELLKRFACGWLPPVMPYFGSGESRVQPVYVRDVARCFVDALRRPETVGQTYPLGGPESYSWKELYALARRIIPRAKRSKPVVSIPLPVARVLAATVMRTPLVPSRLRFNADQVQMSQEQSVCSTEPVESAFRFKLRHFDRELARYAASIC